MKLFYIISVACLCAAGISLAPGAEAQKALIYYQSVTDAGESGVQSRESPKDSYKPKEGYVPNAETAISIAVAVWIPIYGKENIERQKPYQAGLKNGVWTVTGSLPKGRVGGVAVAEISKGDGRILRVIHYR